MLGSNGVTSAVSAVSTVSSGPATAEAPSPLRGRRGLSGRLTAGHILPVLLAVVAAVLVLAATTDRSATELVAVSSRTIPAGSAVNASDVRWLPVHRSDGAVSAGLVDRADLAGAWVAAVRIPAGAPIARSEMTAGSPSGTGLGSMSLEVPPALADGGGIVPGDRVDVISTGSGAAVYVATGLEVLAVAPDAGTGVLASGDGSGYYVTVAVDRATALRLAAAMGQPQSGAGSGIEIVQSTGEPSE